MASKPLDPEKLYRHCDPAGLGFVRSDEVDQSVSILGQERALEAIRFGAGIDRTGYNLFVLGPPGTGKSTAVRQVMDAKAAEESAPDDWVYVNNFATAYQPQALRLPAGRGRHLLNAMRALIEDVRTAIPAAFEAEDYQNRRTAIEEEYQQRQQESFEALRKKAAGRGIALVRTPMGFALAPMRDGNILGPDAFNELPEEEKKRIQSDSRILEAELEEIIKQIPGLNKERRDALRKLNEEVTAYTIGHPIEELKRSFEDLPQITAYLSAVLSDLIENVHDLIRADVGLQEAAGQHIVEPEAQGRTNGFSRYEVNLIVDNGEGSGAPVIEEDHPTLARLVGRVEHVAHLGALETNFTLIKPGALHRANGGCLILDCRKVLTQPFSWEALKRTLKAKQIKIESAGEMLSLVSTVSLDPEPIPLSVKVVLCGEPLHYYLLSAYDPEFPSMFKVAADFDDAMRRDEGSEREFGQMLAAMAASEDLMPFDAAGIARSVEEAARMAGDAEKLSIRLEPLLDLLREADYWGREAGATLVGRDHVQRAIDAKVRRADRLRERSQEAISRDILLIDTAGEKVGQINGISVIQLGGFAFGRPTRITARVRLGAGKVIDIEREVELGGPLHSKGVMILSGYLGSQFAADLPLSLSASLVFEQSYGGIDGDSASAAELFVLLSALAETPIRQSLAVTGSVNQRGEVQAIGGVNEKIEGFFDVCRSRGLTGEQGVIIPMANVQHLMLRADVIAAARDGRFHIHAVDTIDQGIALLTGVPAGERGPDGTYPEDTVFGRVERRLQALAAARRSFARGEGGEEPQEAP